MDDYTPLEPKRRIPISLITGGTILGFVVACIIVVYFILLSIKAAVEARQVREEEMKRLEAEKQAQRGKSNKAASRRFAESFFQTLRQERLNEAYAMTTLAFRDRTGRQTFTSFVNRYPALTSDHPFLMDDNPTNDDNLSSYRYKWTLDEPDGPRDISLTVVLVEKDWKVEEFGTGRR